MLSALKVFDDKAPQYTAAVIMELWSDSTGAKPVYTVKFIYKTGVGSDNETTELHPPGEASTDNRASGAMSLIFLSTWLADVVVSFELDRATA